MSAPARQRVLRTERVVVPDGWVAWWDGVLPYPTEFWAPTEAEAIRRAQLAMAGASGESVATTPEAQP